MQRRKKITIIQSLQEKTCGFPPSQVSALFAYQPEVLTDQQIAQCAKLVAERPLYRTMIDDMQRDRPWLAPQYGLPTEGPKP